ncbi:MAG: LON peptidase substrate-binding domain-containing protein, partial [Xanthomonadaceae bacterium]|nr:LON peptidase substrate-binding domain-containing protein [Xanthomonadaceae bacterium]
MSRDDHHHELPILPLRDVVVYPHMVIPLFVGRDKSIKALDLAMAGDKQILLVAQTTPETDDPAGGDLYRVGTLATVLQLLKLPDGTIKVLVEGASRFRLSEVREVDGALLGSGDVVESEGPGDEREADVARRSLLALFEQYLKTNRKLPPELMTTLSGIDDPARFADTVAAHVSARLSDKQKVLETTATMPRIEML